MPSRKARAGGAVVGAVVGVLLGPAAELRPHEGQHATAEAAPLDVLLEGDERLGDLVQPLLESARLVGVGVVAARAGERGDADREAAVEHGGEAGEALGELAVRVLGLGVEVRLPVLVDETGKLSVGG